MRPKDAPAEASQLAEIVFGSMKVIPSQTVSSVGPRDYSEELLGFVPQACYFYCHPLVQAQLADHSAQNLCHLVCSVHSEHEQATVMSLRPDAGVHIGSLCPTPGLLDRPPAV